MNFKTLQIYLTNFMNFKTLQTSRGQTIVEVLIVSLIITVGLVGSLSIFSQFYALHQLRSEQITATYLAAEGIELVKNLIDTNYIKSASWNSGLSGCDASGCSIDYNDSSLKSGGGQQLYIDASDLSTSGLYSHDISSKPSPYTRTIKIISKLSGKAMEVVSTVNWQIRGRDYKSELKTYFYEWR